MSNFSDQDKKKIFFYANKDVEHYDIVEKLTQPCIDLIHDTMVDLIEYSLIWRQQQELKRSLYILDIGSGTGAEALRLLNRFNNIHIVAIDFSPEMNKEFQRKFVEKFPNKDFDAKVTLLEEDFFSNNCAPERLFQHLPNHLVPRAFDAVIAGFFLHHYPTKKKSEFYHLIYNILCPHGVLVHGDLFNFQSAALSYYAHDFGECWIRKQLTNPDENLRSNYETLGSNANRLRKEWIDHWNNTHLYNPLNITLINNLDQRNQLKRVEPSHLELIRDAGFSQSDCPFRLWEAGIIWAQK